MVHVSTHSVAFVLKVDLIIYSVHFVYTFVHFSLFFVCLQCCTEYKGAVTNKQEIKSCNITSTLG